MIKSLLFFIVAGCCEIGGGYLVWLALREGKSIWLAGVGMLLLGLYGAVPTLQPTHFGRAYAAYGGVFVILSIFWGWFVDRVKPDGFDFIGAAAIVFGVIVMMYAPRT
jgi:small multidrug resistance family-3 protein